MAETKIYDPRQVTLVVAAIPIKDGLADPFVRVTPRGPAFEDDCGIDGEVTIYPTNERRYDVELILKRSSSHNQVLAALHAADRIDTAGAGIGVFLLKDENGATILAGDRCRIMQMPAWEFGKGNADVTWQLLVVMNPAAVLPGGN